MSSLIISSSKETSVINCAHTLLETFSLKLYAGCFLLHEFVPSLLDSPYLFHLQLLPAAHLSSLPPSSVPKEYSLFFFEGEHIQAIFNTWQFFLCKSPRSCLFSVCYPYYCCLTFLCNFSDGPFSFGAKFVLRKVWEYSTLCGELNTSLFLQEDTEHCKITLATSLSLPITPHTLVTSSLVD